MQHKWSDGYLAFSLYDVLGIKDTQICKKKKEKWYKNHSFMFLYEYFQSHMIVYVMALVG